MTEPKHNERGAGRKPKPPGFKKKNYTVILIPKDRDFLMAKYGSLTLAIRSLIINEE